MTGRRTVLPALLVLFALLFGVLPAAAHVHPFELPQPGEAPETLLAIVEIPAGSNIKYEIDHDNGYVFVDRFLSMPVHYPAHYGSLPSLLAADGDPVDVLVFARAGIAPGALIQVRPIGVMTMRDGDEVDDKFIAVPTDRVDPYYHDVREVADLPATQRHALEQFFRVYKNLPQGRSNDVTTDGFEDAATARKRLRQMLEPES